MGGGLTATGEHSVANSRGFIFGTGFFFSKTNCARTPYPPPFSIASRGEPIYKVTFVVQYHKFYCLVTTQTRTIH